MRAIAPLIAASVALALGAGAEPTTAANPLRVGMRVEAEGRLEAGDLLVAETLSLEDAADDDVELSGRVEDVDAQSGAFLVNGVWALPNEDELDRRSRRIARRLEPGDWLEIEGELGAESVLLVDELERLGRREREIQVEGRIEEIRNGPDGSTRLRVGPVAVSVTATTKLEGFE